MTCIACLHQRRRSEGGAAFLNGIVFALAINEEGLRATICERHWQDLARQAPAVLCMPEAYLRRREPR